MFVYFLWGLFFRQKKCPHCGSSRLQRLAHKFIFISRYKCESCKVEFRYPLGINSSSTNYEFPPPKTEFEFSPHVVKKLKQTSFKGSKWDFETDVEIIRGILDYNSTVLDFGCTFGPLLFKLSGYGYKAFGFEINMDRALEGAKFDNVIITKENDLQEFNDEFDLVHSSHVIEHIPDVKKTLMMFYGLLKTDGILFIRVPNCKLYNNTNISNTWYVHLPPWHAIAFTPEFFAENLPKYGFSKPSIYISHDDYSCQYDVEKIVTTHSENIVENHQGGEILVIATKL